MGFREIVGGFDGGATYGAGTVTGKALANTSSIKTVPARGMIKSVITQIVVNGCFFTSKPHLLRGSGEIKAILSKSLD